MMVFPDILKMVCKTESLPLPDAVFKKEQHLPGAISYHITRYISSTSMLVDDAGLLTYFVSHSEPEDSYLQLSFCISGNNTLMEDKLCLSTNTFDVFHFNFTTTFLNQFVQNIKLGSRKDQVLAFRHPTSFSKTFPLCSRKRSVLKALLSNSYTGALENIFVNAKVHELLLFSIECLVDEKEEGFSCRFLADESGRGAHLRSARYTAAAHWRANYH